MLSLTDFLDGFIARKYNQVTVLGSLLDPIADKFLLFSTLITLVAVGKLFFYWALLFIMREFFVVGLRQIAATYQCKIPVIVTAKLKTWFQSAYLAWVISNPHKSILLSEKSWCTGEYMLLGIALTLSIFSAVMYVKIFIQRLKNQISINDLN